MKKYQILSRGSSEGLALEVEKFQNDGWQCQGGVSVTYTAAGWHYAQAMVIG